MAVDPSTALSVVKAGTTAFTTITNALGLKTLQASMEEALEEDAWDFVNEAATHVHQVMNSWEGVPENERPKPAEIGAVLHEAVKAARGAVNRDKRRLLRNAIVNAFSKEMYEEGLVRRLLRVLDDLEYGDVHTLNDFSGVEGENTQLRKFGGATGSARRHHVGVLAAHGLISITGYDKDAPPEESHNGWIAMTHLGRRLLALVKDPA
jgi:hypothetical protein